MNGKGFGVLIAFFILSCIALTELRATQTPQRAANDPSSVDFITAETLKEKVAKNEGLAIIDVRASHSYVGSDNKIKGAIRVKLRRLRARLAFPPLKNISRDTEVVTYCACDGDQASIRAAAILVDAGFKRVRVLQGGWLMWTKVNGQIDRRP